MSSAPDLDASLRMDHLEPPPDLRKAVGARMGLATPDQGPADDGPKKDPRGRDELVWIFDFAWTDSRGALWSGKFRSRIRDARAKAASDNLRNSLCAGMPFDSIAPIRRAVNAALGFLEYALDKDMRPDWAKDLLSIPDDDRILALAQEVASHEAIFWRLPQAPGAGGTSSSGPADPVVRP